MDVSFFAPLINMGVNIAPPVVLMTIWASWAILWELDEKDGVLNHPALRVTVPFVIGIVLFLAWKYSTASIVRADVWDGFVNAAVSVGVYSPVKSYLKKMGFVAAPEKYMAGKMTENELKEQMRILQSGSGEDLCRFARDIEGADISALQARVLEIGTGADCLFFALNVKDAALDALLYRKMELDEKDGK